MGSNGDQAIQTKRHVLAQVVLCKGCCCGQTDKGRPALPEARVKLSWKTERLNKTVQLTISGCLGPCDVANVVQIITPDGTIWFGGLSIDSQYDALIDWARECCAAQRLMPIPSALTPLRFDGYIMETEPGAEERETART